MNSADPVQLPGIRNEILTLGVDVAGSVMTFFRDSFSGCDTEPGAGQHRSAWQGISSRVLIPSIGIEIPFDSEAGGAHQSTALASFFAVSRAEKCRISIRDSRIGMIAKPGCCDQMTSGGSDLEYTQITRGRLSAERLIKEEHDDRTGMDRA